MASSPTLLQCCGAAGDVSLAMAGPTEMPMCFWCFTLSVFSVLVPFFPSWFNMSSQVLWPVAEICDRLSSWSFDAQIKSLCGLIGSPCIQSCIVFFFFAFVGRNRPIGGNTKYFICLYFINHPKKADTSFSFHYWPRSQKLPLYFLDACIKPFVFCYSAFSWSRWQMVLESIPVVTGQEPGQAPSTSVSSPPNVHGP